MGVREPRVFALPGNEAQAERIAAELGTSVAALEMRSFPDGETYLRIGADVRERAVVLVCTLRGPDPTFMPLYLLAAAARQQGARSVGLVAPYLAYMRQDKAFQAGEAITSRSFATLLSGFLDWLVTVDPHLHRHRTLDEIYALEARAVHAAPLISAWIHAHVKSPLLVGPDEESRQWVEAIAEGAGAPCTVLRKVRRGDRDVEVSVPDVERWAGHTAVLADDIISTGRTMAATIRRLADSGFDATVCVGVHAVFAADAYEELGRAGAARIVTCDSIPHPSNQIALASVLAAEVRDLLDSGSRA
jgi:ribose-phosphate pyrophosphokinase